MRLLECLALVMIGQMFASRIERFRSEFHATNIRGFLKVHATLVPDFLLGLCGDAQRIACPYAIVDQCRITVKVISKEHEV